MLEAQLQELEEILAKWQGKPSECLEKREEQAKRIIKLEEQREDLLRVCKAVEEWLSGLPDLVPTRNSEKEHGVTQWPLGELRSVIERVRGSSND